MNPASNTVEFFDVTKAAAFIAELVRQGVVFTAIERENGYICITLTGGY